MMNEKLYTFLKWVALVALPALAALILGIGVVLNWDGAKEVAAVVTLVDTFLGALLGKSSSNFAKNNPGPTPFGDLVVMQNKDGSPAGMRIVGSYENPILHDGGQVSLNIRREPVQE